MAKKVKEVRRKHVPQRTCIACREVLPKRALIRVVRTEAGVRIDPTGKMNGRGAYLHDQKVCWEIGIREGLGRALRINLEKEDLDYLSGYAANLK